MPQKRRIEQGETCSPETLQGQHAQKKHSTHKTHHLKHGGKQPTTPTQGDTQLEEPSTDKEKTTPTMGDPHPPQPTEEEDTEAEGETLSTSTGTSKNLVLEAQQHAAMANRTLKFVVRHCTEDHSNHQFPQKPGCKTRIQELFNSTMVVVICKSHCKNVVSKRQKVSS